MQKLRLTGPFVATRRPSYTLRGYLAAGLLFVIAGALGLAFSGCVSAAATEACGKACASQGGIESVDAMECRCRKAAK